MTFAEIWQHTSSNSYIKKKVFKSVSIAEQIISTLVQVVVINIKSTLLGKNENTPIIICMFICHACLTRGDLLYQSFTFLSYPVVT